MGMLMGGDEMFLRNAPRRSELTRAKSAEWISSSPQEALSTCIDMQVLPIRAMEALYWLMFFRNHFIAPWFMNTFD